MLHIIPFSFASSNTSFTPSKASSFGKEESEAKTSSNSSKIEGGKPYFLNK